MGDFVLFGFVIDGYGGYCSFFVWCRFKGGGGEK